MDVRRFGPGHRRGEGVPGTQGVSGLGIHHDGRGYIGELVFRARARISPHSNPNTSYFIVIEGGGFVQVGDERARVAAGEAVLWPADVVHEAWTELTPMRAIVVEFSGPGDAARALLLEGSAIDLEPAAPARTLPAEPPLAPAPSAEIPAAGPARSPRAVGRLAPRPAPPLSEHVSPEHEPW